MILFKFKFGFIASALLLIFMKYGSAKTAPEFTVTVDTENFKEIRIPMALWKKIITRHYKPAGKEPLNASKETSQEKPPTNKKSKNSTKYENANVIESITEPAISNPIVHEIVLNINVPEDLDEIDGSNAASADAKPAIQEEALIEPIILMEAPVVSAASAAINPVIPSLNPAGMASAPIAAASGVNPPSSVLVQSFRFPCTCDKGICGCCASMFQQKGCANIGFNPEEFAFEMKMTMNGEVLAKRKLPVSDPPPFCFNPRRAPFLELCAQLTNIHFKKQNVHVCVDIDASVGGFDLFSWNYSCLKFGSQGLVTGLNPEKNRPAGRPPAEDDFDFFGGSDDDEGGILDGIFGDDDDY